MDVSVEITAQESVPTRHCANAIADPSIRLRQPASASAM
jgi:hypothetical protein